MLPGDLVRVESASGAFLAWAAYNRNSSIRARVWSFDEAEAEVTEALLRRRIRYAVPLDVETPVQPCRIHHIIVKLSPVNFTRTDPNLQ